MFDSVVHPTYVGNVRQQRVGTTQSNAHDDGCTWQLLNVFHLAHLFNTPAEGFFYTQVRDQGSHSKIFSYTNPIRKTGDNQR